MINNIDEILKQMCLMLDAVKPQDPKLYTHLQKVMKDQYQEFDKRDEVYDIGSKVDKAICVVKGHLIDSVFDKRGDKQVISMFNVMEIKAGPEFLKGNQPSRFYTEAVAGTFIVYITFEQMEEVYRLFPGARELATLITSEFRIKESDHLVMLHQKGIEKVEQFYRQFPHIHPDANILTDAEIASLLLISEGALRDLRSKLIKKGKLPESFRRKNRNNES